MTLRYIAATSDTSVGTSSPLSISIPSGDIADGDVLVIGVLCAPYGSSQSPFGTESVLWDSTVTMLGSGGEQGKVYGRWWSSGDALTWNFQAWPYPGGSSFSPTSLTAVAAVFTDVIAPPGGAPVFQAVSSFDPAGADTSKIAVPNMTMGGEPCDLLAFGCIVNNSPGAVPAADSPLLDGADVTVTGAQILVGGYREAIPYDAGGSGVHSFSGVTAATPDSTGEMRACMAVLLAVVTPTKPWNIGSIAI